MGLSLKKLKKSVKKVGKVVKGGLPALKKEATTNMPFKEGTEKALPVIGRIRKNINKKGLGALTIGQVTGNDRSKRRQRKFRAAQDQQARDDAAASAEAERKKQEEEAAAAAAAEQKRIADAEAAQVKQEQATDVAGGSVGGTAGDEALQAAKDEIERKKKLRMSQLAMSQKTITLGG